MVMNVFFLLKYFKSNENEGCEMQKKVNEIDEKSSPNLKLEYIL